MVKLPQEAMLLRIFIGENDKIGHRPLYEAIVLEAKKLNLAGATVIRGIMGYGATSRVHTAKFLELSTEVPVVIEIADTAENIQKLLPWLDEHVTQGLVTMEEVRVIKYRHNL